MQYKNQILEEKIQVLQNLNNKNIQDINQHMSTIDELAQANSDLEEKNLELDKYLRTLNNIKLQLEEQHENTVKNL